MATRQPFSSQSILYVLLDYADEDKKCDLDIIHKALECTVVLAASVVGGTRLPGVGVGLLGPPFSRLLRLTPVRNNLPGLVSSFSRMFDGITPGERGTEMNMIVSEALDAVVGDAAAFVPASSHPLQVVVVTWGGVQVMTETLKLVLSHAHARYLSAVHVAGVESVLQGTLLQDDIPAGDAAGGVWVTGATYSPDPYTFTALFKSWLLETKGKDAHVHVTFPASTDHQDPLTLLLDVQEVMLDPVSLPSTIAARLTLHHNLLRTVSTTQGSSVAVVRLEVKKRVRSSTLATVVFGHTYYLLPTGANALSFTDIWENRQYVAAVSEQLAAKDQALLVRVVGPSGALSPSLAILPTPHSSALSLVHVAPADLLLAERHLDGHYQQVPDKVSKEMEQRLGSLEMSDLKLVDLTSNLIPALVQHFTKTSRGGSGRVVQPNTTVVHVSPSAAPGAPRRPVPQHPAFTSNFQPDAMVVDRNHRMVAARAPSLWGKRSLRAHRLNSSRSYY